MTADAGRLAIWLFRHRAPRGPKIAASKGALAILIRSIGTDHHRNPHTGVTNWAKGVKPIACRGADRTRRRAARAAAQARAGAAAEAAVTPNSRGEGESGNVIAEVPGSDPAAGIV
jgi:carboxypeptidase Q